MFIDETILEGLIYLVPANRHYRVKVGDVTVLWTPHIQEAEHVIKQLRADMVRGLKAGVVELARRKCQRCSRNEKLKRRRSYWNSRLLHYDKSLGWQPCEAEEIWKAMLDDTEFREQRLVG